MFHSSCSGSEGSGSSILLPTLALSSRARTQCNESVFARRIIDDLIDSKAKDLPGQRNRPLTVSVCIGAPV